MSISQEQKMSPCLFCKSTSQWLSSNLKKLLEKKYSTAQRQYQTKDLFDIILDKRSKANVLQVQHQSLDIPQNAALFKSQANKNKQKEILKNTSFSNTQMPRLFMHRLGELIEHQHQKKEQIEKHIEENSSTSSINLNEGNGSVNAVKKQNANSPREIIENIGKSEASFLPKDLKTDSFFLEVEKININNPHCLENNELGNENNLQFSSKSPDTSFARMAQEFTNYFNEREQISKENRMNFEQLSKRIDWKKVQRTILEKNVKFNVPFLTTRGLSERKNENHFEIPNHANINRKRPQKNDQQFQENPKPIKRKLPKKQWNSTDFQFLNYMFDNKCKTDRNAGPINLEVVNKIIQTIQSKSPTKKHENAKGKTVFLRKTFVPTESNIKKGHQNTYSETQLQVKPILKKLNGRGISNLNIDQMFDWFKTKRKTHEQNYKNNDNFSWKEFIPNITHYKSTSMNMAKKTNINFFQETFLKAKKIN